MCLPAGDPCRPPPYPTRARPRRRGAPEREQAMSPAVSIVMPTFNRLQFLPATLESVFSQTLTDWELIIADDGSDEATRSYLSGLTARPQVRVLWLEHTGRPAVPSNAAIREARGEYVAFLDSDDLWLPQKLARQIASLRRCARCRWSYTRFMIVDSSGRITNRRPTGTYPAKGGWIRESLLDGRTVIAQPSVLVARTLLEELGAFDEGLRMCYDDDLWFRLAARSEVDAVDEPLTLIRRHGLHSGSDVIAWEDRLKVFERLLREQAGEPCEAIIRRQCAVHAAGLARSQAACGKRIAALTTVLASAPHALRYRSWWPNALHAMARALAPPAVVSLVRGRRRRARDSA
jgi:Glycosyl transferase family 2